MEQPAQAKQMLNTLHQEEKQKAIKLLGNGSDAQFPSREKIAELYADISSRLCVIEEYLLMIDDGRLTVSKKKRARLNQNSPSTKELHMTIADMEQYSLGKLEYNNQGIPFRTVTADSSVVCNLDISRRETMALIIDIESVSDVKILRKSQIKIDGVLLEHKIAKANGHIRLHCRIPASENDNVTHLELKTPPQAEVNNYHLAISDVHCVPKPALGARLSRLILRR